MTNKAVVNAAFGNYKNYLRFYYQQAPKCLVVIITSRYQKLNILLPAHLILIVGILVNVAANSTLDVG